MPLEGAGVVPSPELTAMLAQPPDWKRPMVATFLSGALPGAGQLYVEVPAFETDVHDLSALAEVARYLTGEATVPTVIS